MRIFFVLAIFLIKQSSDLHWAAKCLLVELGSFLAVLKFFEVVRIVPIITLIVDAPVFQDILFIKVKLPDATACNLYATCDEVG